MVVFGVEFGGCLFGVSKFDSKDVDVVDGTGTDLFGKRLLRVGETA